MCGFAGASWTHQRHRLAGVDLEIDVLQDGLVAQIAESDAVEANRWLNRFGVSGIWTILDLEGHVQHLEDALSRRHRPLHDAVLDLSLIHI